MDPRAPVNAYGTMSPPPTAKNTMYSPGAVRASPVSSQVASPLPNPHNQMAMFYPHHYSESPAPIQVSPYPTPSSQSTMNAPPGIDPLQYAKFLEFQRMEQQQVFQQPPPNMPPPNAIPPQMAHYRQQPSRGDSGYASGVYDNLGQAHGLPGQHPQASAARAGHTYGKVVAKGNAKVIRGNIQDSTRPNPNEKKHIYGDAEAEDESEVCDGNVPMEFARSFYIRR
ncbi:hypothetical protein LTR70_008519 [Exophiala xenobiotica]|nr:hypothetical protein LTR70_008519 [Exophiala xenobiotica]